MTIALPKGDFLVTAGFAAIAGAGCRVELHGV